VSMLQERTKVHVQGKKAKSCVCVVERKRPRA